jgi:hypothetical protein
LPFCAGVGAVLLPIFVVDILSKVINKLRGVAKKMMYDISDKEIPKMVSK